MGNTSKKLAKNCTMLTKDEQRLVATAFKGASRNHDKIREGDLIVSGFIDAEFIEKYWGNLIDPRFAQYLNNFLFGFGGQKCHSCTFNKFAELYVFNVRGTPDQKLSLIYNCLGKEFNETVEIPYQSIKEYCESLVSTYIKMLKNSYDQSTRAWLNKEFRARAQHVQALGEAVAANIGQDPDSPPQHVKSDALERWMREEMLLTHISQVVFSTLYSMEMPSDIATSLPDSALPEPSGIESMPEFPAFIDLCHLVWLNSHLPQKYQKLWRFLFSSHVHGESFSTMSGRIENEGPSLIILEDKSGYIFGGFASEPWTLGPNFYGKDDSFLFALAPKMRIYRSSGYNDHYQYMNNHTKTLPNGIIMGGQFEFGAIWIPAEPFGEGSSAESCTTYLDYKRLSKEQNFKISHIEVWGLGEKEIDIRESDERNPSILDKNPDAKAILDMAGKARHSEGLREPPPS